MKKLFCAILFSALGFSAMAATNTAATASLTDVQAAVDASTHGDTVLIPNGTVTWNGGITTTKRIIIRAANYTATPAGTFGAGTSSRNVVISKTSDSPAFSFTTGNDYHCGIAGISVLDAAEDGASFEVAGSGTKIAIVQDCYFTARNRNRNFSEQAPIEWEALGGLIFNCVASGTAATNPNGIGTRGLGFWISSPRSWNTASTMGMLDSSGAVNVYVEDCSFYNLGQWPDVDPGGRYVCRRSIMDGTWGTSHGTNPYAYLGGRHVEFYDCIFSVTYNSAPYRDMAGRYYWIRQGTGVFTDCVVNDNSDPGEWWGAQYLLDLGEGSGFTPTTYPELGQPGWGHNGSSQVIDPIYVWNCTGTKAYTAKIQGGWSGAIQQNREFYLNNGSKPGYQKFTYPHPVRGGAAPPDTTPPVISGTNVNSITSSSLIAHWETDETTTNSLDYGTSVAYGTTVNQSGGFSFDQSVTGLSASTLYYFRIRSGDSAGNKSTNTLSATTIAVDSTAPVFTAGTTNIIGINSSGATILGTVNESARSGLTWGYTTATSEGTATNGAAFSLNPSVSFSGATAATLVYIRFWVSDVSGNTNSVLASFTTAPAIPSGAQTYYVDQTAGSDNNTGLTNAPWKNCPGMSGDSAHTSGAALNPGDTVYLDKADTWYVKQINNVGGFRLAPGVKYIGDVWGGAGTRARIRANGKCESGIVKMWQDDTAAKTWFQGFEVDGAATNSATGIDINHGGWTVGMTKAEKVITNNYVRNLYGDGGGAGEFRYGIIVSDNSSDASGWVANVTIVDNICDTAARDFICLYPGDNGMISNIVVRGNYVTGIKTDPSYSEGHGILIKGNVKNSIIEFNTVSNVNSSAVFINGQESVASGLGPCGTKVRYNILQTADNNGVIRFYDASQTTTMTNNLIHDNICWGASSSGMFNMAGYSGPFSIQLYNNTFLGFVDIGNPTGTGTLNVSNNIFYGYTATPLTDAGSDIDNHGHNLFHRTSGTTLASVGGNNYTAGTILGWEPTAQITSPAFSDVASLPIGFTSGIPYPSGLRPTSGSPAVNNGASISSDSTTSDIEGNVRPYGPAWDIGAYEFSVLTVSGVVIDQILSTSARASFELSEGGSAGLTWGTTTNTLDGASTNATASTSHSLNMTSLTPATLYYMKIHAVGSTGTNITSNYTFTTQAASSPQATNQVAVPRPIVRVTPRNP